MLPINPVFGTSFSGNGSAGVSQAISASFDNLWANVLNGNIYQILANTGLLLAGLSLIFWAVSLVKSMDSGDFRPLASEIIYPIMIIIFLKGGGANLANATLGIRDVINGINQQIVQTVGASTDFQRTLDSLSGYSTARGQVAQLANRCVGITKNDELQQCLTQARADAQRILTTYNQNNPLPQWAQDIQRGITDTFATFSDAAGGGPGGAVAGAAAVLGRGVLSPFIAAAEAVIIAFQAAFQYGIEVSFIVTGLFGPIALGLSLLPLGAKPIYAWLTGFISLGMCKIALNVITGLVATAISESGPASTDTLVTAIVIGLLSPILALALASGGGKAVFDGLLAAGASVAATGINIGVGALGSALGGGAGATTTNFTINMPPPPPPSPPPSSTRALPPARAMKDADPW